MKRIVKIIIGGVCWGLPFLIAKIVFQIPNGILWLYYLVFSGILFFGTAAINICYNLYYQKKLNAAVQLYKDGRIEEYIAEVEAMLDRVKGRYMNNMLTINLSAGYCELRQYDKAAELLESLTNAKLSGESKLIHRLNLCLCYFYQKQTDRAMALYENSKKVFDSYRNNRLYEGNIAVLEIYTAVAAKDYVRAAKLLQTAQSTWDNPRFLEDYRCLEEIIHQPPAE